MAEGVYRPSADNRSVYFEQPARTRLCGGFAGTENTLAERDLSQHITIIDGDIGVPGDSTDNVYNVMLLSYPDSSTVVDGFEFRYGNADYTGPTNDSRDRRRSGGGLYIDGQAGEAYGTVRNCRFLYNTARSYGG